MTLNPNRRTESISSPRRMKAAALFVMRAGLMGASPSAMAVVVGPPLVDCMEYGLNGYLRNRFAPVVGVFAVILSMIGHRLGAGRVWASLMYVGMGLGLIVAIGSLVVAYAGDT